MANRAVFGELPGGGVGLKVSKPGANVLTAGVDGLLFDTNVEMLQVVASGVITGVGHNQSRDVTIPNLGFSPFTIASSHRYHVRISFPNATTVRFTATNKTWFSSGNTSIAYAITNVPVS